MEKEMKLFASPEDYIDHYFVLQVDVADYEVANKTIELLKRAGAFKDYYFIKVETKE